MEAYQSAEMLYLRNYSQPLQRWLRLVPLGLFVLSIFLLSFNSKLATQGFIISAILLCFLECKMVGKEVKSNYVVWASYLIIVLLLIGMSYSVAAFHDRTTEFFQYTKLLYLPCFIILFRIPLLNKYFTHILCFSVLLCMIYTSFFFYKTGVRTGPINILDIGLLVNFCLLLCCFGLSSCQSNTYKYIYIFLSIMFVCYGFFINAERTTIILSFVILIGHFYMTFPKKYTFILLLSLVVVMCFMNAYVPVIHYKLEMTAAEISKMMAYFNHSSQTVNETSAYPRLVLWQYALKIISHSPFIGFGTGSYVHQYLALGAPHVNGHIYRHPHNSFLFFGTQLGIVGIIAYCIFICSLWMYAAKLPNLFTFYMRLAVIVLVINSLTDSIIVGSVTGNLLILVFAYFMSFQRRSIDEKI